VRLPIASDVLLARQARERAGRRSACVAAVAEAVASYVVKESLGAVIFCLLLLDGSGCKHLGEAQLALHLLAGSLVGGVREGGGWEGGQGREGAGRVGTPLSARCSSSTAQASHLAQARGGRATLWQLKVGVPQG
jgi:hypothetical protein